MRRCGLQQDGSHSDDGDEHEAVEDDFEKELEKAKQQALDVVKQKTSPKTEDQNEPDETAPSTTVFPESGKRERKSHVPDVNEGKTLHIRSLPFEATADDVKSVFSAFGDVVYVRLMTDNEGKPKGTAFLKFRDADAANRVLAESTRLNDQLLSLSRHRPEASVPLEGLGITVKGRRVHVSRAVSKESAQSLTEQRQIEEQLHDKKKNRHLADIGFIGPESPEWKTLSKGDMKKRLAAKKERNIKLANPNYMLNPLRLSVRNLPAHITKAELKSVLVDLCLQDAEACKALTQGVLSAQKKSVLKRLAEKSFQHVTVCMGEDTGKGTQLASSTAVSKGFGFVTCVNHPLALAALRLLNNAPIFGESRRPIVEFALEDRRALKHHEVRAEKLNQRKQHTAATPTRKRKRTFSRGQLQRQKKRERKLAEIAS